MLSVLVDICVTVKCWISYEVHFIVPVHFFLSITLSLKVFPAVINWSVLSCKKLLRVAAHFLSVKAECGSQFISYADTWMWRCCEQKRKSEEAGGAAVVSGHWCCPAAFVFLANVIVWHTVSAWHWVDAECLSPVEVKGDHYLGAVPGLNDWNGTRKAIRQPAVTSQGDMNSSQSDAKSDVVDRFWWQCHRKFSVIFSYFLHAAARSEKFSSQFTVFPIRLPVRMITFDKAVIDIL